jgi:hypothetical protein
MSAIVVLQAMLLAGVLPFEEQVVYVGIAFLVLLLWFLAVGHMGQSSGLLSGSITRMSVLGGAYVGYPVSAFWLGRQLRAPALAEA